eukprot:4418342-Pleurochrysis_carterae.AAC.2
MQCSVFRKRRVCSKGMHAEMERAENEDVVRETEKLFFWGGREESAGSAALWIQSQLLREKRAAGDVAASWL